jgi:hypothetical protein
MKYTTIGSLAILAGSPFTAAISQIRDPPKQEKYTSGAVMDASMAKKHVRLVLYNG